MMTFKKHILFLVAAVFAVCTFFVVPASHADEDRKIIQTTPFDLTLTAVGVVDKILKPDTLRLENGKIYKLDNIRIPIQFNDLAIKFLEETLLGKKVGFYIVGEDPVARADRFGHTLSHVVTEDGGWIQAQMISRGLGWATASANSRDLIIPLLKYEDIARSEAVGLWEWPEFAVRDNDTIVENSYNSFQVYQGKIKAISAKGEFVFINFGENPQTDFTITFKKRDMKPFKVRAGNLKRPDKDSARTNTNSHTPPEFVGLTVRIRGWVEENGGPMMTLEYQEQLEFPDLPQSPIIY